MLDNLANLVVVLVRPRFPENIGAAARAVANMGLGGLRVVMPQCYRIKSIMALAASAGVGVVERMQIHPDLESALADCVAAYATTARSGEKRGRLAAPRACAPEILTSASAGATALVFGREDRGLTTEEVDACRLSITIPTAEAASLNLAQAVVVMAYELRQSALELEGMKPRPPRQRPAPLEELNGLKDHLKDALVAIGVLPSDNPDHFFRPMKLALERAEPTSPEVRALRGIARQILWLARQIEED